ncbi:hypothetical protein LTR50_004259 [Elasticomyces elasticus]|nr:hypothetical protein LTR50_004259 [Elasticomyces elasticus]
MHLHDLPPEILTAILEEAATLNQRLGPTFTYGMSQTPMPGEKAKLQRYIRGPIGTDMLRWDAVTPLRQVCRAWHEWALDHALRDVYVRRWRGSEKWAELPQRRQRYDFYELITQLSGLPVYADPFCSLRQTQSLFATYPSIAEKVRRLCFHGHYHAETSTQIMSILASCTYVTTVSVPWILLRHGSATDWTRVLKSSDPEQSLQSLDLQAVCLPGKQVSEPSNALDLRPLHDPSVDFSQLRRLKLFGNTTFMPVCDSDLLAIARTATRLEEFHLTCLSTVTLEGVFAIVEASRSTLRVLDHSPRSNDGFFHPHPGTLPSDQHICDLLTSCPKLRDVSISVPSLCPELFASENVQWQGDCQIRATGLCTTTTSADGSGGAMRPRGTKQATSVLKRVLSQARELIAARKRHHVDLYIEIFFASCIFEPSQSRVHGDFALAEIASSGLWPREKSASSKGPYGSTGLYEKDEGDWDVVSEDDFFAGINAGLFRIA